MKFVKPRKNSFWGCYFKQPGLAIIPSVSNLNGNWQAFIQVITNEFAYTFEFTDFRFEKDKLIIADNAFSLDEINLNLHDDYYQINGTIQYNNHITPKKNTMGWYKYLPFLECRHEIISMANKVMGTVEINEKTLSFNNDKGYIEADWGKSFPSKYLWFQCNEFPIDMSLSFAFATVPIFNIQTKGFLCFLHIGSKEYRFGTYNNSKIIDISDSHFIIKKKNLILAASFKSETKHILKAPISGSMDREIHESINGLCFVTLLVNNKKLFSAFGKNAGIEIEN